MQLNFNAFDFDPRQGGSVCFPLADYRMEITKVDAVPVKDNPNAGYLAVHLTCVEGDLKGMVQIDRLNIYNPSETAKRIALQSLAAYAFAIGRPQLATTEQMIGGRLICTVGPQIDDNKYSEVKVIKCPDGSLPVNPNKPNSGPAPQQGAAPAAQPWGAAPPPAMQPAVDAAPPWGAAPGGAPAASPAPPWAKST